MKPNLEKDLCFFDLEATGLSIAQDRIVQIAVIKYYADGRAPEEKCRLVNPGVPIPEEVVEIHGITNEMVQNEPTFDRIANALNDFIGDADLAGYNSNRFDVPLLIEEFHRAGVEFDMTNRKTIDVWRLFQKMEPHHLSAAYRFYCDKNLEGAHDALNDVRATAEIFESQLDKYQGVSYEDNKTGEVTENAVANDMQTIHDFTTFPDRVDFMGRIVYNSEGVPVFNFGKFQNKPVAETMIADSGYYRWFMNGDFARDTKAKVDEIINQYKLEQQNQPAE